MDLVAGGGQEQVAFLIALIAHAFGGEVGRALRTPAAVSPFRAGGHHRPCVGRLRFQPGQFVLRFSQVLDAVPYRGGRLTVTQDEAFVLLVGIPQKGGRTGRERFHAEVGRGRAGGHFRGGEADPVAPGAGVARRADAPHASLVGCRRFQAGDGSRLGVFHHLPPQGYSRVFHAPFHLVVLSFPFPGQDGRMPSEVGSGQSGRREAGDSRRAERLKVHIRAGVGRRLAADGLHAALVFGFSQKIAERIRGFRGGVDRIVLLPDGTDANAVGQGRAFPAQRGRCLRDAAYRQVGHRVAFHAASGERNGCPIRRIRAAKMSHMGNIIGGFGQIR